MEDQQSMEAQQNNATNFAALNLGVQIPNEASMPNHAQEEIARHKMELEAQYQKQFQELQAAYAQEIHQKEMLVNQRMQAREAELAAREQELLRNLGSR